MTVQAPEDRQQHRLRLFVVYHKRLHPAIYAHLSESRLHQLSFYKVNESIPFEVGLPNEGLNIVKEYELPNYDPFFQAHAFNEGSCIVHVHRNRLFEASDYVGVLQYDMTVTDGHMCRWHQLMDEGTEIVALPHFGTVDPALLARDYVWDPPFFGFPMAYVVTRLCQHFGVERADFFRRMARSHARGEQLALLNSFIIRTPLFVELGAWIAAISKDIYDYTISHPSHAHHLGHMGGIIERCVGLFFLLRARDGEPIAHLGVEHIQIPESHRSHFGQI